MPKQSQKKHPHAKKRRPVFLSFEFERDAGRRGIFIGQAKDHCEFAIIDKSLPSVQHDEIWRQKARESIRASQVVIVLLGPDTQNANGVKDELSLAGDLEIRLAAHLRQEASQQAERRTRADRGRSSTAPRRLQHGESGSPGTAPAGWFLATKKSHTCGRAAGATD